MAAKLACRAIAAWGGAVTLRRRVTPGWPWLLAGVMMFNEALGLLVSPEPPLSRFRFGLFLAGVVTYLIVVALVTSPRRFWLAALGLALLGCGVALVGFMGTQWMTYRLPLLAPIVTALPRLPAAWLSAQGTPHGIHPNQLAGVLCLVLPPLVGVLLFRAPGAPAPLAPPRVVSAGALIAVVAAGSYLALSLARGAWLAVLVALLWLLFRRSRRLGVSALLVSAGMALAAAIVVPRAPAQTLLISDLVVPQSFAAPSRFAIWQRGLELARQAPWTGIGLGAFPYRFHDLAGEAPRWPPAAVPHAHNLVLQAVLDLGALGALAYLALLVAAGVTADRCARCLRVGPAAGVAAGLAAGVLAFGLYGLLDTVTLTSRATPIVWFAVGLATATTSLSANRGCRSAARPPLTPPAPPSRLARFLLKSN